MVRFGHDGWTGRLASEVTFESIDRVARVAGLALVREHAANPTLVVGFDRRFLSDEFASAVSRSLGSLGISVLFIPRPVPRPVLSHAIRQTEAVGGIMIGGGSSPAIYNGLSIFVQDGGAAPHWLTGQIETAIEDGAPDYRVGPTAEVVEYDPVEAYLQSMGTHAPLDAIRSSGITLVIDSMWGATSELFPRLTDGAGSKSVEIRTTHNPLFPELVAPHPAVDRLSRLSRIVRTGDAAMGVGISADGCAVGLVDEQGGAVLNGTLLGLVVHYLVSVRKRRGAVGRTIDASEGIDRLAESAGVLSRETPTGYAAMCDVIREQSPMLVGDGEGGIILPDHSFERDGVLAALQVVSFLASTGRDLSQLVDEVQELTGVLALQRERVQLDTEAMELAQIRLAREHWPDTVADDHVQDLHRTDGVKFELSGDSWLLIRLDELNGELEFVAESPDSGRTATLLQAGREMMLV